MKSLGIVLGLPAVSLLLIGAALTAAISSPESGPSGGLAGAELSGAGIESPAAAHAIAFAESRVGVPYLYGGNGPGGFDCSGLVWAAYWGTAGSFSRMGAADEYRYTPKIPPGQDPQPGDLVFFANSSGAIEHVGIDVGLTASGESVMVDAPHRGATVRYDDFEARIGAHWGDESYIGATDPAI